jgi:endonuclease/exonuclease/phosphatase family metal-dependent hydrolase
MAPCQLKRSSILSPANSADRRDFVFVTENLAARVDRMEVDQVTTASDHQPVVIEIAEILSPA